MFKPLDPSCPHRFEHIAEEIKTGKVGRQQTVRVLYECTLCHGQSRSKPFQRTLETPRPRMTAEQQAEAMRALYG